LELAVPLLRFTVFGPAAAQLLSLGSIEFMGLFRIQLKSGAVESISSTMTSLGLPVMRIEQRVNGTHYFYEDPKSKRERCFWTHETGAETFWLSGLSSSAKTIAEGFSSAGLFVDHDHAA
jgi:hypothetical protein